MSGYASPGGLAMLRRCTLLIVFSTGTAGAEVTDSDAAGFTSVHELTISAPRPRVFHALTAEVAQWWDPRHSYRGAASNFTLEARAGGCFCETFPDGGGVEHLRVVFVEPNRTLRLSGGLGPLQSAAVSGSMQYTLEDRENGATQVSYRYMVGGYYPPGLDTIADAVDLVQQGQLLRLKRYLETGSPEAPDST
jgi:uncharacterized protein YndB with AHSA1/START domain